MAVPSRSAWIKLYKDLWRASNQFTQYNFRHFGHRRVRDYFERYRTEANPAKLQELYQLGHKELETVRRQATIGKLYPDRPLVIEVQQPAKDPKKVLLRSDN
ncbi:iron-sulfur cluster biosynthesis protein [Aphelenchoides avenae]|nr:iron-sulfur cluster biosynthesis protein [Aphelenchus avenae]